MLQSPTYNEATLPVNDEERTQSTTPVAGFILHEACAAWPEMSPAELAELAADIAANGLHEPITVTDDGKLLDGRNRALACRMAGVEPTMRIYKGDPYLFSLSKNKHRRHLTTDQIAIVAARLATRTVGNPNFAIGSNEPIGIAEAAKAAGVPETAIKSAKAVLKDGTPEERTQVETGAAPLRATADKVRARMRAGQTVNKPAKKALTNSDPIDDVAVDVIAKVADGKWRTLSKIAAAVHVADTAVREALRRLGDGVEQRKNGTVIEYRIRSGGNADEGGGLRDLIVARDAEIADLKRQVAEKDAEIADLKRQLAVIAAPPSVPLTNKKANGKTKERLQ